jgi:hypothetical protein
MQRITQLPEANMNDQQAGSCSGPRSRLIFSARTLAEMRAQAYSSDDWLLDGYLRRGGITLLVSQWKAGKTTLVAALLSRLRKGGSFIGRTLQSGTALVISEESEQQWLERSGRTEFGPGIQWLCRPFKGRPRADEWEELIDYVLAEHEKKKLDLVVIDPLASFLAGRSESNAVTVLDALLPLQRLTKAGIAVLVLHHPRKGESPAGQAARGSGALTSHVDIVVEMHWFARPHEDDRRRRLLSFSRHDATPRRLLIELNAAGNDYLVHGDYVPDDFMENWQVLAGMFEEAHNKLSRAQILATWPDDYPKPCAATLWRWLDRALKEGLIRRDGNGRRTKPFRYWLVGQEARWKHDPLHKPDVPSLQEVFLDMLKLQDSKPRKKRRKKKKAVSVAAGSEREWG